MKSLTIKSIEEINLIKDLYKRKNQTRDLLMFLIAINTGISLVDLLNLKVKDVKDKLYLSNGKQKAVPLNNEILELIPKVIDGQPLSAYVFKNQFGNKIDRGGIFHLFKNVCTELGLNDKYSVASWRKTFAYHYYMKYQDLSYLQWLFHQATAEQALSFIDEDEDENMNLRYRKGVCL